MIQRRVRRPARKPPETRFDQPVVMGEAHHAWQWRRLEDGGTALLCDGEEVFVAESFEVALRELGARLRSGELEA
jgi:hypothetical protein